MVTTQYVDDEGRTCTGDNLMFGNNALIIHPDFKTVTSDMTNSYFYALNGQITLRDYAPRSIIPAQKVFHPSKVELWVFDHTSTSEQSESQAHQFVQDLRQDGTFEESSEFTSQHSASASVELN